MDQLENTAEFLPRPYQIDLFEKAVKQNCIIYLPTGTGKTYIAVLLIKHLSKDVLKPYNDGGKRTVFIVNTVSLVHQQSAFILRHTGLKTAGYTGEMNVDFWTDTIWNQEIDSNQVLVMTAQIFLNLIEHGHLKLYKVNLLIFDECHRAVKDHPMRQIMRKFEHCTQEQQPRVLGMSASLLNANIKLNQVEKTLKELEITFQSKIITIESLSTVMVFATKPKEFIEFYDPAKEYDVSKCIEEILCTAEDVIGSINIPQLTANPSTSHEFKPDSKNVKLKRILSDIREHLAEMGLYGGNCCVLLHLIQLELIKRNSDEPLLIQVVGFLITQCIKIQKILDDKMSNLSVKDTILNYSSPKIIKLLEILKNFNNEHTDERFCCIIFVKRRFTAKILFRILKKLSECDQELKFLKPDFMIGYNNDPYKNARELLVLSKWNKESLIKFRNGSVNTMIATDVLDEGIDVPKCTLIVRYYAPMDFRAYLQSKGRARHASSNYIVMTENTDNTSRTYLNTYKNFCHTEEYLKKSLHHGNADQRLKPTKEEIKKDLYSQIIKPFIIKKDDGSISIITAQNAVSLVNIYCTSLIKSKFISLTPAWVKIEDTTGSFEKLYKVAITLPKICPFKDTVIGDAFNTLEDAKRSAAVKTCIKLYEIGQLDENLLPIKVENSLKFTKDLFPYLKDELETEDDPLGIPGTNSKKRRHKLIFPEQLSEAYPKDQNLYLHIIRMKPKYTEPDDNRNKVFYDFLNSKKSFGILSTKKIPKIPLFPIFMNVGELEVEICPNYQIDYLNKIKLDSLKVFHSIVFNEILEIIKPFMIFDTKNLENSYLIVPTNENKINWDTVEHCNKINYVLPTKPIEVKTADYKFALIRPTYRASNVYIVTEVTEYFKAGSSFPTHDYETYIDYYKARHNLTIENESQPLLEVKQISKKINCLRPRHIGGSMSKRKLENLTEDFEEHLVPELCEKIDFDAIYWLKATNLPTILHRVSQFLIAENLRTKIASEANLNLEIPNFDHTWNPLQTQFNENCDISAKELNTSEDYDESEFNNLESDDTILEVDVLSKENKIYSWSPEEEPPDLVRSADRIELVDIKRYETFLSKVNQKDYENLKNTNKSSVNYLYAGEINVPKINMLKKTDIYGPSATDILQSLTAKMSNDIVNFERVETLGDSFLKFSCSLFLHHKYPDLGEGPLTFLKGKLVGNLNLYYCAIQKEIPGRINSEEFNPKVNFVAPSYSAERTLQKILIENEVSANILYEIKIPPSERFSGQLSSYTIELMQDKVLSWPSEINRVTGMEHFLGYHIVSDKTVADCVEALLGTYLLRLGVEETFKILKFFEILPKNLNMIEFFSEVADPRLGNGNVDELIPFANDIERRINYKFNNRAFLLQAFTHPSYELNHITASYQRLEFLGDAVLDFLLTAYIYETCGNLNPGELTDLRAALVNNITFACLAVRYGLHTALLQHAPKLFEIIDRFVNFQENREYATNDELLWILSEEDDCNISEHVDVPKALGDIFESVIGAVFLDSNKNLEITWKVIYGMMKKEIDLFKLNVPKQPIRVIYETQGANPKFSKATKLENNQGIMVTLSVQCNGVRKLFHGFGSTKKLAKRAASKQALKVLRCKH